MAKLQKPTVKAMQIFAAHKNMEAFIEYGITNAGWKSGTAKMQFQRCEKWFAANPVDMEKVEPAKEPEKKVSKPIPAATPTKRQAEYNAGLKAFYEKVDSIKFEDLPEITDEIRQISMDDNLPIETRYSVYIDWLSIAGNVIDSILIERGMFEEINKNEDYISGTDTREWVKECMDEGDSLARLMVTGDEMMELIADAPVSAVYPRIGLWDGNSHEIVEKYWGMGQWDLVKLALEAVAEKYPNIPFEEFEKQKERDSCSYDGYYDISISPEDVELNTKYFGEYYNK